MTPEIVLLLKAVRTAADCLTPHGPVMKNMLHAARMAAQPLKRVKHVARQNTYTLGPIAEMQVSSPGFFRRVDGCEYPIEGMHVQTYICEKTGKTWGRFVHEMEDGRFEPLEEVKAAA